MSNCSQFISLCGCHTCSAVTTLCFVHRLAVSTEVKPHCSLIAVHVLSANLYPSNHSVICPIFNQFPITLQLAMSWNHIITLFGISLMGSVTICLVMWWYLLSDSDITRPARWTSPIFQVNYIRFQSQWEAQIYKKSKQKMSEFACDYVS